ncbi:hypothetical protein CY35_04G135400 [Sphagnum magellanicum]|jgi:small subunit ribosomal protein S6|nr:hypothetical protein CY35_04G135400 [Sphagnum magellanicum]
MGFAAVAASAAVALPRMAMVQGCVGLSGGLAGSSSLERTASPASSSPVFGALPLLRVACNAGKQQQQARKEVTTASAAALGSARAVAIQDSWTGMEEDEEGVGDDLGIGQREIRQYPPGLQRYETMAVLRPDLTEDQRLALTQRYEEAIISGGGLDVEMFNRGMQPLAYNIKTRNMGGVSSRYLDGIYLLFTYVIKPESQLALQKKLNADDDIIRSTTFRLKA